MAKGLVYFGLVMSLFFMAMGIFVMIRPPAMFSQYPSYVKYIAGVVVFAYGLFRFIRARKALEEKNHS